MIPPDFYVFIAVLSGIQAAMECRFYGRFSGRRAVWPQYAVFLAGIAAVCFADYRLQFPPLSAPMRIAALFLMGCLLFRCGVSHALLTSVLIVTAEHLSFGLLNAACGLLYGSASFQAIWRALPALSAVVSLLLAWAGLRMAERTFPPESAFPYRYAAFLFLPLLMLFLVSCYIFYSVYGAENSLNSSVNHWMMIVLQAVGYGSLYSLLYACRKLSGSFALRTRAALLEQELRAQREYLQEARARDTRTRTLRHDIKHHLLVLDGFLRDGRTGQARAYLDRLADCAAPLSFACRTGSDMLDILLGSKLGMAEQSGIRVECAVTVTRISGGGSGSLRRFCQRRRQRPQSLRRGGAGWLYLRRVPAAGGFLDG